jgi:general stress protein 26
MSKSLPELAELMKDIDFAMFSTHTKGGAIASRPMSNNGQVEYDGANWFFTCEDTRLVQDIRANPKVSLGFQAKSGFLGLKLRFVSVEGRAELIKDKAQFEAHWTKDLEIWFEDGVDTPGLTLIKVRGVRAHWWDGGEEGEVVIDPGLARA